MIHPPNIRLSLETLRRLYESEGWSLRRIATEFPGNGSDRNIAARLRRAGVTIRTRGASWSLTARNNRLEQDQKDIRPGAKSPKEGKR